MRTRDRITGESNGLVPLWSEHRPASTFGRFRRARSGDLDARRGPCDGEKIVARKARRARARGRGTAAMDGELSPRYVFYDVNDRRRARMDDDHPCSSRSRSARVDRGPNARGRWMPSSSSCSRTTVRTRAARRRRGGGADDGASEPPNARGRAMCSSSWCCLTTFLTRATR